MIISRSIFKLYRGLIPRYLGIYALGHFKQKAIQGEIGSSYTHKINPIDFENSEKEILESPTRSSIIWRVNYLSLGGNVVDRFHGITRNLGVGIAHSMISYQSTLKGISSLLLIQKVFRQNFNKLLGSACWTIQTVAETIRH